MALAEVQVAAALAWRRPGRPMPFSTPHLDRSAAAEALVEAVAAAASLQALVSVQGISHLTLGRLDHSMTGTAAPWLRASFRPVAGPAAGRAACAT